jgi:hypothetical protein
MQPTTISQVISYYSRRGGLGGVSIITEKSDYSLVSQLLIRDANPDDQGTYTCSLSNNNVEAKTRVFVLKGEGADLINQEPLQQYRVTTPTL